LTGGSGGDKKRKERRVLDKAAHNEGDARGVIATIGFGRESSRHRWGNRSQAATEYESKGGQSPPKLHEASGQVKSSEKLAV